MVKKPVKRSGKNVISGPSYVCLDFETPKGMMRATNCGGPTYSISWKRTNEDLSCWNFDRYVIVDDLPVRQLCAAIYEAWGRGPR